MLPRAHLGEPGMDAALDGGNGAALARQPRGGQRAQQVGEGLLLARACALVRRPTQLQRPLRHLARESIQRPRICSTKYISSLFHAT